jgi:ABC-type lipoprotein release transport system permease subunit
MTGSDLLRFAAENLWRMKLRALLTTAGVMIAIGAFVAMLSFGSGTRKRISEEFQELGLLHTMLVYPGEEKELLLDREAMDRFASMPGVRLVYPFQEFTALVAFADTSAQMKVRPIPTAATHTKLFSRIHAGIPLPPDDPSKAMVSDEFPEILGIEETRSLLGETVVVTVRKASLDSALLHIIDDEDGSVGRALAEIDGDSLFDPPFRRRLLARAAAGAYKRFLDGYQNARRSVSDTFEICGVLKAERQRGLRTAPILISDHAARTLAPGLAGENPEDLYASLTSGRLLLQSEEGASGESYSRLTLDLDPRTDQGALGDSIEAMGYGVFSYARQFREMRRVFLFFDLGLAAVAMVAVVIAGLGIMNTMAMSVSERRREIGVLKSLGADEGKIRDIFLVESALIGAAGAILGILLGYGISRLASAVGKAVMTRQGVDAIDVFSTPPWLVGIAFLFGVAVSLASGSIPASKAARVDPVEALRSG